MEHDKEIVSRFVAIVHIVGTSEVSKVLGCPKQQLYSLRKRKDFPKPITSLASTPIWDINDILAFKKTWVRRTIK
jgi:predicted DNA-binding transcriptional regulator AlpA